MNRVLLNALLLCSAMLVASGVTLALTPDRQMGRERKIDLEATIPEQFGDWKLDPSVIPLLVSPDAQALIDKLYDQTLARTYVNSRGERVMLSIAYGGSQSGSLELHKPEVCYAAQGFQVLRVVASHLATQYGELPVKRLFASKGPRNEPITYWVTVGDQAIHTGLKQKVLMLRYGLSGTIPDGMLVRVSSISGNEMVGYQLQNAFIKELLAALPVEQRSRISGMFGA